MRDDETPKPSSAVKFVDYFSPEEGSLENDHVGEVGAGEVHVRQQDGRFDFGLLVSIATHVDVHSVENGV